MQHAATYFDTNKPGRSGDATDINICVLQCVAVRCSALQCDAVWCSALQHDAVWCSVVQCIAVWCSVVQCSACGAVWCNVVQRQTESTCRSYVCVCVCVCVRECILLEFDR